MAVESKIEWTDVTWNPWVGCTAVSEGCHPCYANVDQTRKGKDFSQVTKSAVQTFYLPLQRGPHQGFEVSPGSKVFTGSLMDFFHEAADAWRAAVWDIIRQRPDCAFQILTKRTERIKDCLPVDWGNGYPNVWLVASVENMKRAQRRIPELVAVPAVIHGLSCEPLLGPLDLDLTDIEWVIGGGQSGAKVKPMQLAWARSLRDQCQAAGVPFFFKQWGQFAPEPLPNRKKQHIIAGMYRAKSKADAGRRLDGRTWDEFPKWESTTPALVVTALLELAATIRTEHAACEQTLGKSLGHAIVAGKALLQAKRNVGHGKFREWVEEQCKCGIRTAQQYMLLAKNEGEFANAQRDAHLSLRAATALITKPRAKSTATEPVEIKPARQTKDDAGVLTVPTQARSTTPTVVTPAAATPTKPRATKAQKAIEKAAQGIEESAGKLYAALLANAKLAAGELLNAHGCQDDNAIADVCRQLLERVASRFDGYAKTDLTIEAA